MDNKTKLYATKIFDGDSFAIRKSKVTLKLNKPAYLGMYKLDLRKSIDVRVPL